MPDLRTAKLNFSKRVPDLPSPAPPLRNMNEDISIPSPLSLRKDSGSSASSGSRIARSVVKDTTQTSPTRPVPSMAFERNSYFRRISTLPTAAISNTLPKPILCLLDAARSILFAVCQVYQTLEHYTLHAIDDRLKSVLRKVLDPASADMMQLINSLDRFDAMSRKTLPPPAICRAVVESCKDTVAVFGKAVGVLALQLKVIATGDDVRYLRSMLLVLYGATAEVSCAWQAMVPHIESIKPLLRMKPFPTPSPTGMLSGFDGSPDGAPANAPFLSDQPPPVFRSRSANGIAGSGLSADVARTRTARRHAGSFSSKDVEIGKKLPSYDDVPVMSGGVVFGAATHTPTLRTPKRQVSTPTAVNVLSATPTGTMIPVTASSSSGGEGSKSTHSRQGSQASLQASSASSSPSIAPPKTTFLELPSTSKTQVDKEALRAVQEAVDVAPAVWDMMEDTLSDILAAKADVRESLDRACAVTRRLSEVIHAMQEGDSTADKKAALREDAHVFLKVTSCRVSRVRTNSDMFSS